MEFVFQDKDNRTALINCRVSAYASSHIGLLTNDLPVYKKTHHKPMLKKGTISHANLWVLEMKAFTGLFQCDITSPGNNQACTCPVLRRLLFRPGLKVVHHTTKEPVNISKAEYVVNSTAQN